MSFYHTGFFICAFILCFPDSGLSQQRRSSSSTSGSGTSVSQVVDFDCPEEFGYYPHPADCTQYYVCVFGGALLESCTGGLMYSHELQTCDWPRNVGCGSGGGGGGGVAEVVSTTRAQESPRQRQPPPSRTQQQPPPPPQQQQQQQYVPQRQLQREEAIPKHHLYTEEDLGPAEEVESDRQQRVYRGQPATLGQVARDRDGLSRHSNAIQITPSNGREKLSVISFGTQQQYRTDTETRGLPSDEAKLRRKRQVKFSFPGDTRAFHPSASSSVGSWAASPPFPLPFPPPQPSWPPFTQHYSQDNVKYFNNKLNLPPQSHQVSTPQFSKPFRFPIKDNDDDFVPVVGKGVKLPKPSPELLITLGSIDKPNVKASSQRPPGLNPFLPLDKQPDNYAFFNLETLPRNHNSFNGTVHHVIVLSSNNTSPIIPNLFSLPNTGTNNDSSQKNSTSSTNQIQTINNIVNVEHNKHESSGKANDTQVLNSKSPLNLIASASHSEESQLAPSISYHRNKTDEDKLYRNNKMNHRKRNSKNKQNNNGDESRNSKKNLPYNSNSYTRGDHSQKQSHQDDEEEEEEDDQRDDEIQDDYEDEDEDEEEEEDTEDKQKPSDQDEKDSTSKFESPAFPPPPKEFFEDPSKKYENANNPFSDPDFDFDKFFDELADDPNQRNNNVPPQHIQHQQEISEDKLNANINRDKLRKLKHKQNHEPTRAPNRVSSYHHQTLSGVGQTPKDVYRTNKPKQNFNYEPTRYITEKPHQVRNRLSLKKAVFVNNRPQNIIHRPLSVNPVGLSQSSEIDDVSFHSTKPTATTSAGIQSSEMSDFVRNQYSDSSQSVPRNHKYKDDSPSEAPTPFSFNFTDQFKSFFEDHNDPRVSNSYPPKDPKYGLSNEEPSLYTVHRQNSLSNPPHETSTKYDDQKEYDEEDYYGSNENYDYFDEELSLENLHSPNVKQIKPPDIPNKLKNIDLMTFDKQTADEEYDDTSAEREDESDKQSHDLNVPYTNNDEITDCSKKYKNHKCSENNNYDKNYGEDTSRSNEDYEYDDERNNTPPPKHYEVVEDIAESQQSLIKSSLKNNSNQYSLSSYISPNNSRVPVFNGNVSSNTINLKPPLNFVTNNLSSVPTNNNNTSQIHPLSNQNTYSQKFQNQKIPHEILLKALSADKGTTYRSVNRHSHKSFNLTNKRKHLPITNTTVKQSHDQTDKRNRSSQMTPDGTKHYFSSTLPLKPKLLKDFRQRHLTNFTPTGDIETSGSLDQPLTLLTPNSHLTNSLTFAGRQSIAPPPYVEQTTTRVTSRGYNSTQQQQQYTPSPYDPYYNIYEDDSDLYKDIDYSQYSGQQFQSQPKQQPAVQQQQQQQVQAPPAPSRKPTIQYSPTPPPPASYNAVQQDVYNQAQDYNDNYNLQDDELDYKQTDIDLKGNRSRTAKRQDPPKPTKEVENGGEKQGQTNLPLNRRLTLTASFSFDDDKSPVTSSRKLENKSRQRTSLNSFQVDEPSTGSQRDTHELVLSYLRQENTAIKNKSKSVSEQREAPIKPNTFSFISQTPQRETVPNSDPKRFTYFLHDLETSEISTTQSSTKSESTLIDESQTTTRPFRIVVPTTEDSTLRSRYSIRRGNKHHEDTSEISTTTNNIVQTVKPYKLPPLSRETIDSSLQQSQLGVIKTLEQKSQNSKENQKERQEKLRRRIQLESRHPDTSGYDTLSSRSSNNDTTFIQRNRNINYSLGQSNTQLPQNDSSKISDRLQNKTISQSRENVSAKDHVRLSYDPSSTTVNRYSSRLITTPSIEESVVKLIPIEPVRSRAQYDGKFNEEEIYKKYTQAAPSSIPVAKSEQGYQVTEENLDSETSSPSYSAINRRYQAKKKTESQTEENINSSFPKESHLQVNSQPVNDDFSNNGRPLSRFPQTTEKPFQKSLYSLRINNNNRNLNGEVGGLVLATLEAVTVSPENSDKIVKNNFRPFDKSLVPTSGHDEVKDSKQGNNRLPDQIHYENENNTDGNARNNQIRMRSQSKIYTMQNNENVREHQYSPSTFTSTEDYENEEVIFTPMKKQHHNRVPSSTESPTRNDVSKTTKEERVTEGTPKQETKFNWNTESYTSIKFDDAEANRNFNQPRRQLRFQNRLESVKEDEESDQSESGVNVFDSEEEPTFISQKNPESRIRSEEGRTNNQGSFDHIATRGRQSWTTSKVEGDEPITDDNAEDVLRETAKERHQNMRKMHIRKKIRVTTLQPETSSSDLSETPSSTIRSVRFQTEQPLFRDTQHLSTETSVDDIVKTSRQVTASTDFKSQDNLSISQNKDSAGYINDNRESNQNTRERGRVHFEQKDAGSFKSRSPSLVVDPYSLISTSFANDKITNNRTIFNKQITSTTQRNLAPRINRVETKSGEVTETFSPIAAEINSYFRGASQNLTNISTSAETTTPYTMTTVERIRDKFRLGTFPKPAPSSNSYDRKPSVDDNTPPPLPSDRCSQELDSDPECNEKPLLRVRPTSASPDSQSTPGLTRGSSRHRGSATYTVSPNEAEPSPRGTPSSLSRNRPTLKPSTSIISKASEFIDIYRYPPSRPEPIYPTPQVDKTAAKCRKDVCLLPDCSCGGKEIPGELPVEETPQIVLLTFDDSVNDLNKGLYSDLFEKGRTNPNGCPISATFYVSHEWTDYSQVQNLYATGHEIASHSVSHSFGEQFSVKKWTKEIAGQREILAAYGGVKQEDIRGMRAPFLAIGGNKMFKMLYDSNFTYDSSMPVYENRPPSWPYTLDYKIFHDCMIPPCPTRSYPGVWEVPMVMWQDLNGGRCSMGDACSNPPTADGVYKMLVKNFERHFTTNRSPFGLFYHAAWFTQPHHKEGFIAFIDTITKMPEVWLVTNWQAIQWVRDPTPISRLNNFAPFGCNYPERPRKCMNPKVCNLWHKSGVRYMRTCQPCPDIYPWTGKTGVRNSRVDNEIITE